jgi:hypothetical protein
MAAFILIVVLLMEVTTAYNSSWIPCSKKSTFNSSITSDNFVLDKIDENNWILRFQGLELDSLSTRIRKIVVKGTSKSIEGEIVKKKLTIPVLTGTLLTTFPLKFSPVETRPLVYTRFLVKIIGHKINGTHPHLACATMSPLNLYSSKLPTSQPSFQPSFQPSSEPSQSERIRRSVIDWPPAGWPAGSDTFNSAEGVFHTSTNYAQWESNGCHARQAFDKFIGRDGVTCGWATSLNVDGSVVTNGVAGSWLQLSVPVPLRLTSVRMVGDGTLLF